MGGGSAVPCVSERCRPRSLAAATSAASTSRLSRRCRVVSSLAAAALTASARSTAAALARMYSCPCRACHARQLAAAGVSARRCGAPASPARQPRRAKSASSSVRASAVTGSMTSAGNVTPSRAACALRGEMYKGGAARAAAASGEDVQGRES
jgi:hypothetical protein